MDEPLIQRFEEVWQDIAHVCSDLSEAEWDAPTDLPGWSVKDNVAHMIGTERMLLGQHPSAAPDSGEQPYVKNDIGRANELWVATYRPLKGSEVLEEFEYVTAHRIRALRELTPEEWDKEGFTPEGPGPYRTFMAIRVFDCWYHDQDIREAVQRPGFVEGAVADMSLARIPAKGLGYVVGKKAAAPPNSTIVFDIAGSPPIVATVSVPPEGRATVSDAAPDAPTVRLGFDRRTFARLAGGRWTGAEARARGVVEVAGDAELGFRVVDNMAFTI
jgi:uncharacterized protein (TIGR03083 family)